MNEDKKLEVLVIRYTWITGIAVFIILFFATSFKFILPVSYLLGLMTGLMCFTLRIKTTDKAFLVENHPRMKRMLVRRTYINLFLYLIVLALAAFSQYYRGDRTLHLNVFAVFGGIMTLKVVIYFKAVVIDHILNKRGKPLDSEDTVSLPSDNTKVEENEEGDKDDRSV